MWIQKSEMIRPVLSFRSHFSIAGDHTRNRELISRFNSSRWFNCSCMAEIVAQRSEEVRHQGSGPMSIGGIRLAELGAHPLFLNA